MVFCAEGPPESVTTIDHSDIRGLVTAWPDSVGGCLRLPAGVGPVPGGEQPDPSGTQRGFPFWPYALARPPA